MSPEHLAVYGTLVPGAANDHVLADVPGRWSTGVLAGTRHEHGWHGYPGVVLGGSQQLEVHVLHAPTLADHLTRLDRFEGPGYRRVTAPVTLDDGQEVTAWVYELVDPPQ